ncbi:hypothetical protein ED733_006132 [Metarhizium rileyi]|uniref:AB hydrolase-1 domain-containing protein n=1 Tax=Metarhizium rileyi (strain RCEF 4871) TaxID=1649241 RepID=A0A5C6GJ54_METRR|nr:hypothetical protein ED733_006132 [Metarhizium rileyi]
MPQTVHFNVAEHVVPACHIREYPGLTAREQEDVLHLHVKQYTPRNAPATPDKYAVTLIAMHGNGFPKLYEPLWDALYQQSETHAFSIRGIWIADMAPQGMSGVLNERKISNDNSWMDHSRDMLLIVNHFRHLMPRPLVGVGHSCGGLQILFTSIIFLDPGFLIVRPGTKIPTEVPMVIRSLTYRKDIWPNRAAAARFVKKSCPDWDQRAMDLMVQYGFRDLPTALFPELPSNANASDPPVTLVTTVTQSVLTHARPCFDAKDAGGRVVVKNRETHADLDPEARFPLYRPETQPAVARLPALRPSALFVLGAHTEPPRWRESMRAAAREAGTGVGGSGGMAEGRVLEVVINGGHLFPFTAVKETGRVCAQWLGLEMDRYRDREKSWESERSTMAERDHMVLPAKWTEVVRHPKDTSSKL